MIYNLCIKNFHRIYLSKLSNKYFNKHSNKSYYSVVNNIFVNKKLLHLSYLQSDLSLNYLEIVKFSNNSRDNMEKFGDIKSLIINYDELIKAQNDNDVLIIDVREQKEIDETGKLPGSIHIPMGNVSNMLTLNDEQFKKNFKKLKPNKDTKIILSCKSGMRSATVQDELQKLGYKNAFNYSGGWSEWENKHKK